METIFTFLNDNFDLDKRTVATLLVPIFIFFLGVIIQRSIKSYDNFLNRQRIRKLFRIAVLKYIKQTDAQSSNYEKIIETFRFENNGEFELIRTGITSMKICKEIGFQATYNAYFTGVENSLMPNQKFSLRAFSKIWNCIIDTEYWHEKSFDDAMLLIEKFNMYQDKRNDALEKHRQLTDGVFGPISSKPIQLPRRIGEYLNKVAEITEKWQQLPNPSNPKIAHENLVTPILELNRNHSDIALAIKMNNNLLEASAAFANQDNNLIAQRQHFKHSQISFKGYSRLTSKGIAILANRRYLCKY